MEEHEYESIRQMQGSMSHRSVRGAGRLRARELHEGAELVCAANGRPAKADIMATRESRHTVSGIVITDFRLSSITRHSSRVDSEPERASAAPPSMTRMMANAGALIVTESHVCPRQYHVHYAGLSPSGTASHSGHA